MRGLLSLSDIIDITKYHSMDTVALTDINGIWGFIRFVQHCGDKGIKPIAGVNLIKDNQEVLILVENQYGYENLCRIISKVHSDKNQKISDILKEYNFGLFVLAYDESILRILNCFISNTHLFVELRPGIDELSMSKLSKKLGLEMVVTGDVYFKSEIDHQSHMILQAIDQNITLDQLNPSQNKSKQHWFRDEKQIVQMFPNSLDGINNSRYLSDRCKKNWPFINTIFPGLDLKETYHSNRELKKKVYEGAKKRYENVDDEIQHRIEYELDIINQKGFGPYFLIVHDIVNQTRATIGRGSAAASIVSYCLFITQVDPIKYTLQFERFIHPEREDMPDIDVDFPWDERDSILDYVFKKYGRQRTAMVANQVFLRSRSAIREVGKVYGLSNEEIKSITKRISWYKSRTDLNDWVNSDHRFANVDIDSTALKVLKESEKILGAFRYPSVHPGGVVIVPDEIRKYVPVLTAPKGVQIVEWEKDQVEDSGLLKIDLLGNRSLSVVRDTIRNINLINRNAISKDNHLDYHKINPVGDHKTEQLMSSGKTMGVFYIESPATRQLLLKSGLVDFEHVVIYSSIIRPAANRYTNLMLSRIHGEAWNLMHPDLEFLRETYGIMVYEEQVAMAGRVIAGFGYADAETLRKIMSRNSMKHHIPLWKERFVRGALQRGYSPNLIDNIWDMIQSFVGYSFCKPHSASYTMLSFTCAYLKAHFTAEFLASVISNQGGYYSSYAYMSEARRFGIKILKPDINNSMHYWYGRSNKIQMGFMSIKGLKRKAINLILDDRKAGRFISLDDFLFRVDIHISDAMALTNANCFRSIAQDLTHQQIAYQVAGFYLQDRSSRSIKPGPLNSHLSSSDLYELEMDTFGFPISVHPLSKYRPILSPRIKYAKDIPSHFGRSIYLIGIYITRKESKTSRSEPMGFLTLEDESDIYECVLFPNVFKLFGDLLRWETLLIIRGTVEKSFGVYNINIEKIASIQQLIKRNQNNPFSSKHSH
tara:strand:+ start:432 stop:3407 length:2976 start_codon:yes stop_codon:yes gene_type:complete